MIGRFLIIQNVKFSSLNKMLAKQLLQVLYSGIRRTNCAIDSQIEAEPGGRAEAFASGDNVEKGGRGGV